MLSLGASAIGWDAGQWISTGTFSVNLKWLPFAVPDTDTRAFWDKHRDAWDAATKNQLTPEIAMGEFSRWLHDQRTEWARRPVALGAPAGFDFPFVRYYMIRFNKSDAPFGHSCIDMKSVASDILKMPYYDCGKRNYPQHWFRDKFEHTHIAGEDAREQAWIFARMMEDR